MQAYKTYTKVNNNNQILISDLPFESGDIVEVVVFSEKKTNDEKLSRWKNLFSLTQSLHDFSDISEDDIKKETDDYITQINEIVTNSPVKRVQTTD